MGPNPSVSVDTTSADIGDCRDDGNLIRVVMSSSESLFLCPVGI